MDPRLASVLGRLDAAAPSQDIVDRLARLVADTQEVEATVDRLAAVSSFRWLLDRAADGGLPLTGAGYLKPDLVRDLADVLPTMQGWMFGVSREINTQPVLHFREAVQRLGLVRKHKGTLVLTPAGRSVQREPAGLWRHLVTHLIPDGKPFDVDATVLVLLYTVTTEGGWLEEHPWHSVVQALTRLGWAHADGRPIGSWDVSWTRNDVWAAIGNVGPRPPGAGDLDRPPSPAATLLVREALLTEVDDPPQG
jgi:hypothetical protein